MFSFEWYGQSCFKVENSRSIVTDPHNGDAVGLNPPPASSADLVTISHGHSDHASGESLVAREDSVTLKDPGSYSEKGMTIRGIDSFHDKAKGAKRGDNVIFVLDMEEITICHLGDLGHELDEEVYEKIGKLDLLMVPVGGNYTIDGSEAAALTKELNPMVVIPMHFRVEGLTVDIGGPEEFLEEISPTYEISEMDKLDLEELPEEKTAVKLDCLTA